MRDIQSPLRGFRSPFGGRRRFNPASLFRPGDVGVLFEPQRMETMWQDVAGTTPVTAYGQSWRKWDDRSGGGRHATQANTASGPIYGRHPVGGVRNKLLATDTLATQSATVTAVAHTLSFTGTGTVTLSGASTAGPLVGTGAGNRVSLTFTPTAGSLTMTVSGSVTLAQLEIGSSATACQKVTTAYDVTEAGKADCYYGLFDGVDNSMATAAFAWGSDKLTIIAAMGKNSDATGIVAEFGIANTDFGGWYFASEAAGRYDYAGRGARISAPADVAYVSGYPAPDTAVITVHHDINSGQPSRIRRNGTAWNYSPNSTFGGGNFGTYQLNIGRRNNSAFPFNGKVYGLFAVNRILSADELALAERLMAAKYGGVL